MFTILVRRNGDRYRQAWHFEDIDNAAAAVVMAQNAGADVYGDPSEDYITDIDEFQNWLNSIGE